MLNILTTNLNPYTGYGKLNISLLKTFALMGVDVRPEGEASWDGLRELPDTVRSQWLGHSTRYPMTLITGVPEQCFNPAVKDTQKVFYGMSETTAPSPEWVELFNSQYQAVLVPCQDLVTYYQAAGVKVPVHNVGMGMDYHPFPTYHKDARKIKEWRKADDGKFIFLSYSYNDIRKGAQLALQAYNILFEDSHPDVELWIKVRPTGFNWWDMCQNRVRIIPDTLSEPEWYDLLRQVDCFVFPSFGEGFGLPPRESVICGTPAIATEWLGMADVANWGLPIKAGRMWPSVFDDWTAANAKGSKWCHPDDESLKEAMLKVYAMSPEARWVHALRGRRYLRGFTWQQTAVKILDVLKGLEHGLNSTAA